jgi:undecaprenyl-diphosphatase
VTTIEERNGLRLGLLVAAGTVVALTVVPLAVLVRDRWDPLRTADADTVRALRLPPGSARDVVLVLTQFGAPLLLELVTIVLAGILLIRHRRRLALYLITAVFGAELLSTTSKHIVARVRPCAGELPGCPHSTSFPSGHAVGAAAFWTAAAVLLLPIAGRAVWALAACVPLLVATTRVLLGVHYPSDVVAGLLLGWCWTAASTAVFATWRDERAGRDVPLDAGLEGQEPSEGVRATPA